MPSATGAWAFAMACDVAQPLPTPHHASGRQGARIKRENDAKERKTFRIVGPDEFDRSKEYTSMDSPLGKAVIGKSLNDEVIVTSPNGDKRYSIVRIHYQPIKP